jgi:hypothetical protein
LYQVEEVIAPVLLLLSQHSSTLGLICTQMDVVVEGKVVIVGDLAGLFGTKVNVIARIFGMINYCRQKYLKVKNAS